MAGVHRALLPALAALVLVLVLWPADGEDDREMPTVDARGPADGAHLIGAGRGPTPADRAGQADGDPDTAVSHVTRAVYWSGSVSVAGTHETVRFDPPAKVTAYEHTTVFSSRFGHPVDVELTQTGHFRIDVTPLLEAMPGEHTGAAWIHVQHDGYMTAARKFPLPPPVDLLGGRAAMPEVDLVLQPAGRVCGRVLDADGSPREGASVRLHRMTPDGCEERPADEASTGDGGAFTLRFAIDGRYLLVATWRHYEGPRMRTVQSRAPASLLVDLVRGVARAPVELRLRPGLSVRGRIRIDGEAAAWASVTWQLAGEYARLLLWKDGTGSDELAWMDGQVHWAQGEVNPIEDGTFEIHGLSPCAYRVRVDALRGVALHARCTRQVEREIVPPERDLLFDVRPARVLVTARWPGGSLKGLTFDLMAVGMAPELAESVVWGHTAAVADSRGRAHVALLPDCSWYLTVNDPGFEHAFALVRSPGAGETTEVTLDLTAARPRARLVVTLDGAGADWIERAAFGFYDPGVDPMSRTPHPIRLAKPESGRYVLDGLHPGRYRLHVRPGREWYGAPATWLEAVAEVEIPEVGEAAVRIYVMRGGRVHLELTDPEGRHLEAQCTVLDTAGNPVPTEFRGEDIGGGSVLSRRLPGTGPCWIQQALAPGRYTLRFEREGHEPVERTVRIEAGATATVQAVMRPTR
jgi:hypothetical protein